MVQLKHHPSSASPCQQRDKAVRSVGLLLSTKSASDSVHSSCAVCHLSLQVWQQVHLRVLTKHTDTPRFDDMHSVLQQPNQELTHA